VGRRSRLVGGCGQRAGVCFRAEPPSTAEADETVKGRTCQSSWPDFITSLDGYGAAEGWPGGWGLEGPEYLGWLGEQPEGDYTILMGASTYRLMSGFVADGEPGTDALTGMSKIVFSSSLTEPLSWANSRLITGDATDAVREMEEGGSESMRTLGSLSLCRSLLQAGLVDRFRVVVFPVLTGSTGKERIYDGYPDVSLE
jgi:dihydrofolate reductase